ncbi:MAG: SDR family NAD(P)-dependent oxidoreductase [Actinomycetota bacterium]
MERLDDKRVVITGAASGMGRAYATEFAKEGVAGLILCDVNEAGLAETVELVRPHGDPPVFSAVVDVADEQAMLDFADESRAALGDAHIVINNAGIVGSMDRGVDTSVKAIEHVFAVNFYGVVHGTLAFMPQLEAVDEAALVNVSSIFGLLGVPGNADYCATKFAVRGYTETLMAELADSHIQVHLLHPGGIDTNIVSGTTVADDPDAMKMFATDPADVAKAVIEAILKNRRRIVTGHLSRPARFLHNFVPVGAVARLLNREMRKGETSGTGPFAKK